MFQIGSIFGHCVFMFYALYRQIFKQDRSFEHSTSVQVYWIIFHLIVTLLIIHMAAQITSEVCIWIQN